MSKITVVSRRKFMSYSLGLSGLYLLDPSKLVIAQSECELTPKDVLGPFYRPDAPERDVLGDATMRVYGKVTTADCQPIPGAMIEIWQADPEGEYDFTSEEYNYYARIYSGKDGSYQFYTDLPGRYPQRPRRHIHYRVRLDGESVLITQQYFDTDDPVKKAPWDFVLNI